MACKARRPMALKIKAMPLFSLFLTQCQIKLGRTRFCSCMKARRVLFDAIKPIGWRGKKFVNISQRQPMGNDRTPESSSIYRALSISLRSRLHSSHKEPRSVEPTGADGGINTMPSGFANERLIVSRCDGSKRLLPVLPGLVTRLMSNELDNCRLDP